jgi:hypothetical protein
MATRPIFFALLAVLVAGCTATAPAVTTATPAPGGSTVPAAGASATPTPAPTATPGPATLAVTKLEDGTDSKFTEAKQQVLKTKAEFEAFWAKHDDVKAAPSVDFDKDMVLAVFVGEKSTGGYTVAITGAVEKGDGIEVTYKVSAPEPGGMNIQVLTYPYVFATIPRSTKTVKFTEAR